MTTPNELLTSVKLRFPSLIHKESDSLETLLVQALTKYQDLAGVTKKLRIQKSDLTESNEVALPDDFLARVVVNDNHKHFIVSDVWDDAGVIELGLDGGESYPLVLTYLVALGDVDIDSYELPKTAISLLSEYLQVLIAIPNAERLRRVLIAGKMDTSDVPLEADLQARKTELEEKMAASKAMLPTISFF